MEEGDPGAGGRLLHTHRTVLFVTSHTKHAQAFHEGDLRAEMGSPASPWSPRGPRPQALNPHPADGPPASRASRLRLPHPAGPAPLPPSNQPEGALLGSACAQDPMENRPGSGGGPDWGTGGRTARATGSDGRASGRPDVRLALSDVLGASCSSHPGGPLADWCERERRAARPAVVWTWSPAWALRLQGGPSGHTLTTAARGEARLHWAREWGEGGQSRSPLQALQTGRARAGR